MAIYVTYADSNYAAKLLAMTRSLKRVDPEAEIYVMCCDRRTWDIMKGEPVHSMSLETLEAHSSVLPGIKVSRSWVEYLWTLTPIVLSVIMLTGAMDVTYADADLYFYHSMDELKVETHPFDISAIPHRWTPKYEQRLRQNGKYNVAWLRVKASPNGVDFLDEWTDLCLKWCYNRVEDGKMGDQGYLDALSEKYGFHDVEHLGANLAPWSQEQYNYTLGDDGSLLIDGQPLLFYHFHEFKHNSQGQVLARTGYPLHPMVAKWVYPPYEAEIAAICKELS